MDLSPKSDFGIAEALMVIGALSVAQAGFRLGKAGYKRLRKSK